MALPDSTALDVSFLRQKVEQKEKEVHFNVLRIINNTSQPVSGSIHFAGPDNWRIIAFRMDELTILPGDSTFIPVRVSIPQNAIGGLNYVLNGTFRSGTAIYADNAYITIPKVSSWRVSLDQSNIYFNVYRESVEFNLNFTNKGNVHEMVKLEFDPGRLLHLEGIESTDNIKFINLPASTDTTLTYSIKYTEGLKSDEVQRLENNWKESAISVKASTFDKERNMTVRINKLKSDFENVRAQNASPLNVEYQVYNLLSSNRTKFNSKVFGSLLFQKERELDYLVGINNIYFKSSYNQEFDFFRQFKASVRYKDPKMDIFFSDNNNGGHIHYLSGWGVTMRYKPTVSDQAQLALIRHPFSNNQGIFAGYERQLKQFGLRSGITAEENTSGNYKGYSLLIGPTLTLFKKHHLVMDMLVSNARYGNYHLMQNDTSVLGISYRLSYRYSSRKMQFRVTNMNTTRNYIKTSGINNIYAEGRYKFNDMFRLDTYYSRNKYAVTRFPYSFYFPTNYDLNEFGRLTGIITRNRIIYQFGPVYNSTRRHFFNPQSGFSSTYTSFNPGFSGSTSFRVGDDRTITPNLSIYNIRFKYESEDPAYNIYDYHNVFNYSAGVNYYDRIWKVSVNYTSGETTDLFRSVQLDEQPVVSQSIQIRPAFEKWFRDNTIRISGFGNYLYYMPSGRENIILNLRNDYWLKGGWLLYFSANIFMNSRVEEETGRNSSRDMNLFMGIRKSFDIQQPRLKYHDISGVFFNDLNGNMIRDPEEPPVANMMVVLQRNPNLNTQQTNFAEISLVSSADGYISYTNIPEGNYNMTLLPLDNLGDLYVLNGFEQLVNIGSDQELFVPLAESYKVRGKVVLDRDPNSSEGRLSFEGIKITAFAESGETYSTLTDAFGYYVLNVPQALKYKVRISNVFGEQFSIEIDEYDIQFADFRSINIDFRFIEKRREIRTREGEEFFDFQDIREE